jgi:hypothetical protein
MDCFVASLLAMTERAALSEPVIVPAHREFAHVDIGLPSRQQIRQHPSRAARHGPAERAVAGVEMQIAVARRADHRRSVWSHRPQTAPERSFAEIAAILGNDFRRKLKPLAESRWSHDPFARGSYSHALPGHAGDRAVLAAAVDGRLFFAGEATSPEFFSTAHGARDSGERAAQEVLALTKRR